MNRSFIRNSRALRLALTFGIASVAITAFAQDRGSVSAASATQVIHPASVAFTDPPVIQSTLDVFPQIRSTVSPRAIRPDNPKRPIPEPAGPANNLTAGGINPFGPSNQVSARFPGISNTGATPPDPDIAVGPNHVVQVVNTNVAFFDKGTGAVQYADTLDNNGFFNIGATPFVFDPKVFYDQGAQRFVIVALELDNNLSKLLIACSDDSNPNGVWYKYRVDSLVDLNGQTYWLDYPGFGYNKSAVVVTGNMFPFLFGGVFVQSLVFRKADMLVGNPMQITKFNDFASFTVQPAKVMDSGPHPIFGVSRSSNTTIKLFAYTNLASIPQMSFTNIPVPLQRGFNAGAPTSGGGFLDTIGDRVMDSAQRDGKVYACLTIRSADNRAVVRWYEVNPKTWPFAGGPELVQSGDIDTGTPNFTYMPAINVNLAGAVSLIFTESNENIAPRTLIASRQAGDPPGTLGTPIVIDTSTVGPNPGGVNRWGDYFAVEVDPVDNLTFWGNAERLGPGASWQTIIQSWTVTAGAPGATTAFPTAATVLQGTLDSGAVGDLAASDDVYYSINSVGIPARGQYAAYDLDFTLPSTPANTFMISFTLESIINPGDPAAGYIYFWNYTTNTFDRVKSYKVPTSGNTQVSAQIQSNLANYIGPGNAFKVRVMSFASNKRSGVSATPFRLRSDFAKVTVNVNP